ncbi:MAG: polysaccharide pyruvyl transferase family protein [Oscillospiraceae bacterium]
MNIAIISKYYKNYNFGGLLQAYALTRVLNDMGHNAVQISFKPNEKDKYGNKEYAKILFHLLGRELVIRMKSKKILGINQKMIQFMYEIPHTRKVTSSTIGKLNQEFDCFIAGSDQIWNPSFSYDEYFLKFVNDDKLKISYAASIGVSSLDDSQEKYFRNNLKIFDSVSVREFEAKHLLERNSCRNTVEWVLDPTMLLTTEKWLEIDCYEQMNLPKKYILVYSMSFDKEKEKLITQVSNNMGIPIVRIPFTIADYNKSDQICMGAGPREFATLIRHAELILTDSFHATSFSIINHKKFFCMQRDKNNSMNSRLDSLFRLFEIKPRWISCIEDIENLGIDISYEQVENILNINRKKSFQFLVNALDMKGGH